MNNQFALMKDRRFWPLFYTQFLGAFNDNLFKTTLSVMVAYEVWDLGGARPEMLVSLAAALFIVPFVLFTPLAGMLADKYDKDKIIRILKITEIVIVAAAIGGLVIKSIPFLLFVLFLLGAQSAFFSPSKFSIMPQHLKRGELIGGNALVSTGTYLAILLGNILGSLLALNDIGIAVSMVILTLCAAAGYIASRYIPAALAPAPSLKLSFNVPLQAFRALLYAKRQPDGVFAAIIASGWFFFVGAMLLAQFPNFTRQTLGVNNLVLTMFMAVFSLGVALGGLLNNRLLRGQVEATFVPPAALAITLFSLDLYFASAAYAGLPAVLNAHDLMGPASFLSSWSGWRIVLDLLALSVAGGLYAVPVKSIIQDRTPLDYNARVLAASSLTDALFVLASALAAIIVFAAGFEIRSVFMLVALGSAAMALYIARALCPGFLGKIRNRIYE